MGGSSRAKGVRPSTYTAITGPRNTEHNYVHRLFFGTPTLGTIRMEWHNAIAGMVTPTNFSCSKSTPIGFRTDDAQNLLAAQAIDGNFAWLLLIEDDVVPPVDLMLRFRIHCEKRTAPLVSGLYHLKGNRPEPIMYKGRGNGPFRDFKPGQRVWVDGVPTGCLLVDVAILRAMREISDVYELRVGGDKVKVHRIFEAARYTWQDPSTGAQQKLVGTSDLFFCDRIIQKGIFKAAGWPRFAKKKYPFLVDTTIACGHIDRDSGHMY